MTALSEVSVFGRSFTGTAGKNRAEGYECLSLVCVVCCQVEILASSGSFVQRSPTNCV